VRPHGFLGDRELCGDVTRGRAACDQPDDLRVVVEITAAGGRALRRLDKRVEAAQAELVAPLSTADRRELRRLLTRLVEHHSAGVRLL
jgi:MarR family transcriptional regulator, lower aerobic nicotinate degradation pathway regulator